MNWKFWKRPEPLSKSDHLAMIRHLAWKSAYHKQATSPYSGYANRLEDQASREIRKAAKAGYGEEAERAFREGIYDAIRRTEEED